MSRYSKYNIIYRLQKWMDTVPGQTFLNYAYSWGASVVILGALFKLTHLPGANIMLFIGMGTEVCVFFISAFDRPFDKTADGRELPTRMTEEYLASGVVTYGNEGQPAAQPVAAAQPEGEPVVAPQPVAAGGTAQPVGGGVQPVGGGAQPGVGQTIIFAGGGQPAGEQPVAGGETPAQGVATVVVGGSGAATSGGAVPAGGQSQPEGTVSGGQPQPEGGEAPVAAAQPEGETPAAEGAEQPFDPTHPQQPKYVSFVPQMSTEEAQALNEAQGNYVQELQTLVETLKKVNEQSERLTRDSEEMENLNRTLTGISKVYEIQLKGASQQIGTIDQINAQTKKMAEQIEQLNQIYARMIDAMSAGSFGGAPKNI